MSPPLPSGTGDHATLLYELLDKNDGTNGNGQDIVHNFFVGIHEATGDTDRIDLADLLIGYNTTSDSAARYINGRAESTDKNIPDYLKLEMKSDTAALGGEHDWAQLFMLKDAGQEDLATLLANHQIIIG